MLLQEMIQAIEKDYPCQYALEWDNVGLLAGRDDKEVQRVYIALDATDDIVDKAIEFGADLIITHHPLIFSPLKQINNRDIIGRRLLKMIQNDISYYAMHTNYDVLGMSELAASYLALKNCEILQVTAAENGEKQSQGMGRVGFIHEEQTLEKYCNYVKQCFGLTSVKVFGDLDKQIKSIAVSPGSGSKMVEDAIRMNADVLVTGDIDHHTGIDANAWGLHIIDAGHYGIEHIFIADMKRYISGIFPELIIMEASVKHPFLLI